MSTRTHRRTQSFILFLALILFTWMTCLVFGSVEASASQGYSDPSTTTSMSLSGMTPTATPVTAAPFKPGLFDDMDSRFVYSGDWDRQSNVPGVIGGTLHVSNTLGNTLKFQFTGNELRVFFQAGPGLGNIRLKLDTTSYVMNESSSIMQSYEWVLAASNTGMHTVTITHDSGDVVNFDAIIVPGVPATATPIPTSTPTPLAFVDVPASHPYYQDILILSANGLTGGCQTSPPKFCPDQIMNRGQAAVFMLRGNFGSRYIPLPPNHIFHDDWSKGPWAEGWAEAMRREGLSAGCFTNPLKYCPWDQIPREQAVIFALRLRYGKKYTPPPATGTLFSDMANPSYYATAWAEQAYRDGLIPNCGMSDGKPKFCPKNLVSRGLAAYMIVQAKNLSMP